MHKKDHEQQEKNRVYSDKDIPVSPCSPFPQSPSPGPSLDAFTAKSGSCSARPRLPASDFRQNHIRSKIGISDLRFVENARFGHDWMVGREIEEWLMGSESAWKVNINH